MQAYLLFFFEAFENLAVCLLHEPLVDLSPVCLSVVIKLSFEVLLGKVVVGILELVNLWVELRFGSFLFLSCRDIFGFS